MAGLKKQWTAGRALLILVFLAACVFRVAVHADQTAAYMGRAISPVVPVSVFVAGVAWLAASVRWNATLHGLVGQPGLVRRIGVATYPLYLLHDVIGIIVLKALLDAGSPPMVALAGALVALVVLSLGVDGLDRLVQRGVKPVLLAIESWIEPRAPALFRRTRPVRGE